MVISTSVMVSNRSIVYNRNMYKIAVSSSIYLHHLEITSVASQGPLITDVICNQRSLS